MTDKETGVSTAGPNKMVVMLLAAVAVLLVVIVVIIVMQKPAAAPVVTDPANSSGAAMGGAATSGMGGTAPADVPFDIATATKVAEGKTPEDHVTAYFDAVVEGDFATAYELLPLDKKTAQDEAAFAAQLEGYGVESYQIDDVKTTDTGAEITATATMAGGGFQYLWTFVKDGDTWYVKSRTLPGMGG